MDLPQGGAHARAFDLEAADGPAALHPVGGLRVILRGRIQHSQRGGVLPRPTRLDELGHVALDRQPADAQQVDLDQPEGFHCCQVELGDGDALAAGTHHRYQVGQRTRCHHHSAGVDRQMPRQLEQRLGFVENALELRGSICSPQLCKGRRRHSPFLPELFHARPKPIGQPARHFLGSGGAQPVGLGYVSQGRARPEAVDRPHHGDALLPVDLEYMPDHPVTPPRTQVRVDVRRGGAGRVEEALEVQVQPQRVRAGDAQAVRHQRGGGRPPRGVRHTGTTGEFEQLLHDQEDGLIAHARDHLQLVVEPFSCSRMDGAIQPPGPCLGFAAQVFGG